MKLLYILIIFSCVPAKALNHEVYFTNPTCKTPKKPTTYCTDSDYETNYKNPNGVFQNYVKILFSDEFNKVIISYLSYSNSELTQAYKKLLLKDKPEFTIILDDPFEDEPYELRRKWLRAPLTYSSFHQNPTAKYLTKNSGKPISALKEAYRLLKFAHENKVTPEPKLLLRGQTLGSGFSHMKMTYLENSKTKKLILGSANLSQGLVLHHENWHIFTDSKDSNFVEVHKCILDHLIDENISFSKQIYSKTTSECSDQQNDQEYKAYFIPGQGKQALKSIKEQFNSSDQIWIAAHRFSNNEIIENIKTALNAGKQVRLLVDDDLFWVTHKKGRYLNTSYEAKKIKALVKLGLELKYVSTNNNEFLLHHNKYLVFITENQPKAVFTGAGNLTYSAFSKNFENYFLTTNTNTNKAFYEQYEKMWTLAIEANELASTE